MKMNSALFDEILNTSQDCVFWKDKERRFVGVNKAFLDFYGFESDEVLIGKTDEDMGWHTDPEPYKFDELRVLEGHETYKVPGKCIIRGRERDIIASKRPIYDNGEIVGLVGSFMDVTDLKSNGVAAILAQELYTSEKLRKHPYFDKLLDEIRLEEILDSLTGVVSRAYIISYAKSLIERGIPFTFTIFDLDNFKFFNDTYGHRAGDEVLMDVSRSITDSVGDAGVVGRFGGDEFIIVNTRDIDYDAKKQFFIKLYDVDNALRKSINVDGNELFLTGTSGCATYPDDALDYETLFSRVDKAMYRGKNKGRNCYIIYVEEKHKNLEIKNIAKRGLYTSMHDIVRKLEFIDGFVNKLKSVFPMIQPELNITDLYFTGRSGKLRSVLRKRFSEDASDIDNLVKDDLVYGNKLDEVKENSPKLYESFVKNGIETYLIVRIAMCDETDGYLICAEPRSHRIWQEAECGLMYFLGRELAARLKLAGEEIP